VSRVYPNLAADELRRSLARLRPGARAPAAGSKGSLSSSPFTRRYREEGFFRGHEDADKEARRVMLSLEEERRRKDEA